MTKPRDADAPRRISSAARFPGSVAAFLRANPGYTRKFAHLKLPPERAYFRHRVLADWRMIRPHVAPGTRVILDIGSGIAGIDLLLHRALPESRLVLVDKSRREQDGRSYDVVAAAREFLTANGVADEAIVTLSSQADGLADALARERYDLVLSLRGLGYMFPYQTYRRVLRRVTRPGSRLILDIRRMDAGTLRAGAVIRRRFEKAGMPDESEVLAQLRGDFGRVEEIGRSRDYSRVLVTRVRPQAR